MDERFPRELAAYERDLLLWILPAERPGYSEYRTFVQEWKVVARGRRGEGNYILAPSGEQPDHESPLPQILAYGVVETTAGELSVSVRERLENQVEFEVASARGAVNPAQFQEVRRWTLSTWLPSHGCPHCGEAVRQARMSSESGRTLVLAICSRDRRLWVYDENSGVNHPIPVTNFYNELMLHKNIRDPKIALDSKRLFAELPLYSDADLTHAFRSYNMLHMKVMLKDPIVVETRKPTLVDRFQSLFGLQKRA